MKNLKDIIQEKLKVNSQTKINQYEYYPKNKEELDKIIKKLIEERGQEANLNDISTSKITDMSELFELSHFNGDISQWDVSNVKTMKRMFIRSEFNGDISKWDVSRVKNMREMFYCSKFNGDISNWDVSNVEDMDGMFAWSKFNCSNGDISNWEPSKDVTTRNMFVGTPNQKWKNTPKWLK